MQILAASEIKRRGIGAIEEKLPYGPVHIIKHNHLACVVLSAQQYEQLTHQVTAKPKLTLSDLLIKPATGYKSKAQLDEQLRNERMSWEKRK